MKYLIRTLIAIILSPLSYAYEGIPSKQVDLFFSELSAGKANEAIDNLYASNPAMQ